MKMKTKIFGTILIVLIALSFLVAAHSEEDFTQAENLIQSKISCDQLSDEQLEMIGDYYMEQIHPGDAHEAMDEMMGGEGSESLKQMHIAMARDFYCGDYENTPSGMMGTMMGHNYDYGSGIGAGMMGVRNYGMMGYYGGWNIYTILGLILLIGLIFLVYMWIWKLWKNMKIKKR